MKKASAIATLLICLLAFLPEGRSQQRPLLTHYPFQQLAYNPAYAGAKGYLQSGLSYRAQWMGLEGAPRTAFFNVHSGMRNKRVGLGLQVQADWVGPSGYTQVQAVYSYGFELENIRITAGVQAGMENYRADWSELDLENPLDDAFPRAPFSWWNPVIGVGLQVQGRHWYAGASCPYLLEQSLFYGDEGAFFTHRLRHAYAMAGGDWDISREWRFLTAGLLSVVAGGREYGSPASLDAYAGFFYRSTFLAGVSLQTGIPFWTPGMGLGQSGGLFAVFQLDNGLRFGLSYDLPFSRLAGPAIGSLEWTMGYELTVKARRITTPRFFW